jgi:hypothetical protein
MICGQHIGEGGRSQKDVIWNLIPMIAGAPPTTSKYATECPCREPSSSSDLLEIFEIGGRLVLEK